VQLLHEEMADGGLDLLEDARVARVQQIMANYKVSASRAPAPALTRAQSNEDDWRRFAVFDPNKYTRNLVDDGNGKFNLMLLAWGEGHHRSGGAGRPGEALDEAPTRSAVHDHAGAHCVMKILDGEVVETQYCWPDPAKPGQPLSILKSSTHKRDQVAYISGACLRPAARRRLTWRRQDRPAPRREPEPHQGRHLAAPLLAAVQVRPPRAGRPARMADKPAPDGALRRCSECRTFSEASGQARGSGKMCFYTIRGERLSSAPP
jgi:cysteine dioxygenase